MKPFRTTRGITINKTQRYSQRFPEDKQDGREVCLCLHARMNQLFEE